MGIVYLCHEGSCHIFIYNVMLLPTLFGKESVEEKEKNETLGVKFDCREFVWY